ncbi:MAG: hypothetical protein PUP93_21995 [Rhizonema sp. NSF051]|nr:hypothetical protein [Rhizonema sp. NSF051]
MDLSEGILEFDFKENRLRGSVNYPLPSQLYADYLADAGKI